MPHNDGDVRTQLTDDCSKLKKEIKEIENALQSAAHSAAELFSALGQSAELFNRALTLVSDLQEVRGAADNSSGNTLLKSSGVSTDSDGAARLFSGTDDEKKFINDSVRVLKDRLEADRSYTKEMYYNDLETLISILDKESDLYKKYNSEILKGRRNLADAAEKEAEKLLSEQEKTVEKSLSNILKQFQKAYDELEKKRENYKKKLLSIGGDIFSVEEIEKPDGTKVKQYTVKNIDEQIKAMRKYNADIAKLKKQGASSALLNELTYLKDSDSQEFAKYLSGMSAGEFAKINELYNEKQRVAEELSKEMYADEYAAIADGINTALDEVSAGAADKGKEAAESYAKAFGDTLLKHSEDFSNLLDAETYAKWFGNSGDTPNFFTGDMEKLMRLFVGSDIADIAAKVTSTVRSEQARYSAPAYAAAAHGTASDTASAVDGRKGDIAAILEKINKPLPIMLDGKVIAEAVMSYQNNYARRANG